MAAVIFTLDLATIMATISIAVFAKTPALTPVKTRLAASIGTDKATQFYQHSLNCTAAMLRQLQDRQPDINIFWAVAEEEHQKDILWQNKNTLWTGPGDLGQRLHHVYQHLKKQSDIVILLGSDCPQLSSQSLINAINILQQAHQHTVIGPAEDGGFYLFASDLDIQSSSWMNTRYSENSTREQLIDQLNQPVHLLEHAFDIDTLIELQQLHTCLRLRNQKKLSNPQQQLLNWLNHWED